VRVKLSNAKRLPSGDQLGHEAIAIEEQRLHEQGLGFFRSIIKSWLASTKGQLSADSGRKPRMYPGLYLRLCQGLWTRRAIAV
jgi:hypothetical protein